MARTLRLALTGVPEEGLTDYDTRQSPPAIWDANALTVLLYLGSVCAGTSFTLANIASLKLEIRGTDGVLLLTKTVSVFTPATEAQWKVQTNYHATFGFTNAELDFSDATTVVWFDFIATMTNGDVQALGAGFVNVISASIPPGNIPSTQITVSSSGDGYLATFTPSLGIPWQWAVLPVGNPGSVTSLPASISVDGNGMATLQTASGLQFQFATLPAS